MKKLLLILLLSCPIWNVLAISGLLKQSTAVNVTVVMIDSTDHVVGKTGLTLTIRESKSGGAFAAITPTVTELEGGVYSIAFTAAHTDTLGELRLRVTAAGADESDPIWQVVALLPGDNVTVGTNLDKTGYSLSALDSAPLESGTAQTGGANTITLRIGADVNDNTYNWEIIEIYGGLGAGQSRVISDYNGTTKIATVNVGWKTVPDNTSLYRIISSSPDFDANGKVTFNNGSIGSVTSAIILPAIPNNWITAAGIAANALNGKGDWLLASSYVDIWNVTLPSTYTGQKAGALLWKIGNRPN